MQGQGQGHLAQNGYFEPFCQIFHFSAKLATCYHYACFMDLKTIIYALEISYLYI